MIRLALAALLVAVPSIAFVQAVARPVVTASAGYLRAADSYDGGGNTDGEGATVSAVALGLGAEAPVFRRADLTVSVGARLALASYEIEFGDDDYGSRGRPQRLDVFGRLGNARASALLGVSVDLGQGIFGEVDEFVNSDGQHAVVGQLRGETPAGRVRLFAQADAAVTLADDTELLYNGAEDPAGVPYPITVDSGDPYGLQVGAAVPVGPVELGLAVFYAARSPASYTFTDGVPVVDGRPEIDREQEFEFGYDRAVGLLPSVAFRAPAAPVVVRLDGSFSEFWTMEGVPVGLTLSGAGGPVTRPAVTLGVGVGL